ncbi:MAG: enoyl-CoA hydratase/isomerase family protein, partial [Verrucomicrobiales bacterium]|nr:enoyl-CoA hydratase/isomerase family protein [Verrucomicrobiales bacterium]
MTGIEAVSGTVSPKGGEVVHMARDGEVGIILIDNPPVNALGAAVRAGLAGALESLGSDPAIKAIVLGCAGRTFAAGADITEFGKPKQQPDLQAVVAAIESASKPVVAALHGTALGGGLELA